MNAIDQETRAAFGDVSRRRVWFGASDAMTANFLEGGTLQAPSVLPPALTAAQQAAAARAKEMGAASRERQLEEQRQRSQASYELARAKQAKLDAQVVAQNMKDPAYAAKVKAVATAGTEWAPFVRAGVVLAAGAAIIASGGAVAGAIAAPSAATVAGAAVAADRALAAAEKAKLVKPGIAGQVSGVVDAAVTARAVLDNTAALAQAGVPGAVKGLEIIAATAARRAATGALPGVPQALTAAGAKAFDSYVSTSSPALGAALAAVAPKPVVSGSLGAALSGRRTAIVTVAPKAAVEWFVSNAGKVSRGSVTSGKGWRVYGDGKVVQQ